MLNQPDAFDLAELSDRAGVSQRTVRYYIQQGLLPSPETRGPGAHYGPEHLDRLRLIRTLQRQHLPLAEIRRRLEELGPEEIRALLAADRTVGDAKDYIRSVLSEGAPMLMSSALGEPTPPYGRQHPDLSGKDRQRKGMVRAQWDRIPLAADVELHVRRPLSREQNKQIERLLEAARHIFEEE
ncbi:MAG: MerR family transcriptional regulator [Gemmatimonadaceae bacterium]